MQTQRLLESPNTPSPHRSRCGPSTDRSRNVLLSILVAITVSLAVSSALYFYGVKPSGEYADIETCSHEIAALQAHIIKLQDALLKKSPASPEPEESSADSTVQAAVQAVASAPSILAEASIASSQLRSEKAADVTINLGHLLGPIPYFEGISWDIWACGPPLKVAYKNATDKQVTAAIAAMEKQLMEAMKGFTGQDVRPTDSWVTQFETQGRSFDQAADLAIEDPRTQQWVDKVTLIMANFLVGEDHRVIACPDISGEVPIEKLGRKNLCGDQTSKQMIEKLGYYSRPLGPINAIAHGIPTHGTCTRRADQKGVFGQWLKSHMYNKEWKTFNVQTFEEDAVVFLYDVLYEKLQVFKRQYWLGAIAMQHPYDFFSIADIIWSTKPDLIIETGTANGGSALMWASLMELNGIKGTVVTVDLAEPAWDVDKVHWGGQPRINPLEHPLWKKYVKFIKGGSTDPIVVNQIKKMAAQAKSVLVMLDSHHANYHVQAETKVYCPMVTVDNYCIIEDTKLSRYTSDGPLPAAKEFAAKFTEDFQVDRDRELVFTQHAMGYLKRIAIKTTAEQFLA